MPSTKPNLLIASEWLWSNRGKNIWWTPGTLSQSNPDPTSPKLTDVEAISIFKVLLERGLIFSAERDGRTIFLLHEAKEQEWNSFIGELNNGPSRKTKPRIAATRRETKPSKDTETKSQWWWKTIIGSGGIGVIVVALIAKYGGSNPPAQNFTGVGNNSGAINGSVITTIGGTNTFNSTTIINSQPILNTPPHLPIIRIETLDGLPMGFTNNPHLRVHSLVVRNNNEVELDNFCSRLQLPEPIIEIIETNNSIGATVAWKPLKVDVLVKGTGGRSSGGLWIGPSSATSFHYPEACFVPSEKRGQQTQFSGAGDVTGIWELTADKLPPGGYVSFLFITDDSPNSTNYIKFASTPLWQSLPNPQTEADTNELRFSLEGEYQFKLPSKSEKQRFLVPIRYDAEQRKFSSLGIQADFGNWHPVLLEFY